MTAQATIESSPETLSQEGAGASVKKNATLEPSVNDQQQSPPEWKPDGTFSQVNDAYLVRKKALRETIQMIKEIDQRRQNSVFKSRVERFKEDKSRTQNSMEKPPKPMIVLSADFQNDEISKSINKYPKANLSIVHENEEVNKGASRNNLPDLEKYNK